DGDLALDARVDRVADAERGGEAMNYLADVGALEVEDHCLFLAERGLAGRLVGRRRRCRRRGARRRVLRAGGRGGGDRGGPPAAAHAPGSAAWPAWPAAARWAAPSPRRG